MTSATFPVCNGIKQGIQGILSHKLFNTYVDILSQQLNKVMVGCCMNGKVINHLYYTDDLVLLSPSAHGMQKLLSQCEKSASEYGMKFNENNSVVLNFKGYKFKAKHSAALNLNGSIIKTETSYKNLGQFYDNNLNDNKDIERQLRNFYGKSNMLLRTFSSCSHAVKLQLFLSYCVSMLQHFSGVTSRKGNTDNLRWLIIMYSEDLWVTINIAVPVVCLLKTELMVLMHVYGS